MQIRCAARDQAQLGEGALWDSERAVLWWVDIRSARIHCYHADSGTAQAQQLSCRLTALGLTHDGDLIACGDRGFVRVKVGADLQVSIQEVIAAPVERAGNRYNDGKVDPQGHFWAGTMDDAEQGAYGALYRLDPRGGVRCVRRGMSVPNGPCFLADGTILSADSARRQIMALQLNATGEVEREWEFTRFSPDQGFPDGMTVDAENHVWVAFWDGWCVRRLAPDGAIVQEVSVPVQRPTCPAFGGPQLSQLYLTTARVGIDPQSLASQPLAGSLLMLEPPVRGLAPARFGRASDP